jgi:hypothetical protein
MLKTRTLKIFDCLKNLIIKIHVQSKILDFQRVLKEINYMHRDLTKINFFVDSQVWFCESERRIVSDDENLREEFEHDNQTLNWP